MSKAKMTMDEMFSAYGEAIYRYGYRMLGDVADAEDMTQETFVTAMVQIEKFRGDSSVSTWLFGIAHNKARRHLRRKALTKLIRPGMQSQSDPTDRISYESCLSTLTSPQREAFVLVKVEGLTCIEAAQIQNVPVGTVKYRVFTATKRLQSNLLGHQESSSDEAHDAL